MINTTRDVANLIANMAMRGATKTELRDVIEYSKGVIDLEKNYNHYNIEYLERKYSGLAMTTGYEHTE